MKQPRISVTVLYPLGFEPGVTDGWREIVNECFNIAMTHLGERIAESGWGPSQGQVEGPHVVVEGVIVPQAVGFFPDEGEVPEALSASCPLSEPDGGNTKVLRSSPFWGVFGPDSQGVFNPCVTEDMEAMLAFKDGATAIEMASRREDCRVLKCWLSWDGQNVWSKE